MVSAESLRTTTIHTRGLTHVRGFCLSLLTWKCFNLSLVQATVYTHNTTDRVNAYPSLPALFGEPLLDGRVYEGRMQYLVDNPFLCEEINWNTTTFVDPTKPPEFQDVEPPEEGEKQPIVLLAARGQCPFHYKAMVAESLGARVEYLIIYNHNLEGEDVLVPMYSEFGTSRLKLLSVTHRTGLALKMYIAESSEETLQQGGPLVSMDSIPPEGVMTAKELQDDLISMLGLFFMLVSFSGCFLICAAAAQQGRRQGLQRASPIWMILMGDVDVDPTDEFAAAAGGRTLGGRTLLTQEEIEDYLMNPPQHDTNVSANTESNSGSNSDAVASPPSSASSSSSCASSCVSSTPLQDASTAAHCAICIDDFDQTLDQERILKLPCHHLFHSDCIIPWLTERQSKCPLCKFDVMAHVQELAAREPVTFSSRRSRRRQRGLFLGRSWFTSWTAVNEHEEETLERPDGIIAAAELELTETPASHDTLGRSNNLPGLS